jgi:uroporphyrinogen III methyltransferase / synthase
MAGCEKACTTGLPLCGRLVAVTRAAEQAGEMVDLLLGLGAAVLEIPAIRFVDPQDWAPFDRTVRDLASFDWVVFTSANGAARFFERLHALGINLGDLKGVRIACIGPATARAVASCHLQVDLLPSQRDAEGLASALKEAGAMCGSRVLLPRPDTAGKALPGALTRAGAQVVEAFCYRTLPEPRLPPEVPDRLAPGDLDLVAFMSPSAVRGFVRLFGRDRIRESIQWLPAGCIGPATVRAAREAGFAVVAKPPVHRISVGGLVEAIAAYLRELPGPQTLRASAFPETG